MPRDPVYRFGDERDSTMTPGTEQILLGTGVSVWRGGQRGYLLSASTRRSTSSSTFPVLGRWRWSSRSLSSALVRPS